MRIQIRYGWHFDSRAERLQDTAASGTAGNQPPHRTRNAASHRVRRLYSSTPRSGLAAPRPRFPPRAAPTARRACTGRFYRPCSSITGMSEVAEVPAPVAGLPTARSPGRPPSAEYLKFLDEGGELIDMANFDFTDNRNIVGISHTVDVRYARYVSYTLCSTTISSYIDVRWVPSRFIFHTLLGALQ